MNIKLGDIVQSEYGKGKVVAMTKQWVIHETETIIDGKIMECAVSLDEDYISIPVEVEEVNSTEKEIEI